MENNAGHTDSPSCLNLPHTMYKRVARELAMQYLYKCGLLEALPDLGEFAVDCELLKGEHGLNNNHDGKRTVKYAEKLITAVALNQEHIDKTIMARTSNWGIERISQVDLNIMRIAIAEMLTEADTPPVVSINEAVEIARDFSGDESGNFINGVLNAVKNTLRRDPRSKGIPEGQSEKEECKLPDILPQSISSASGIADIKSTGNTVKKHRQPAKTSGKKSRYKSVKKQNKFRSTHRTAGSRKPKTT